MEAYANMADLKKFTNSSGLIVYWVDKVKNEITIKQTAMATAIELMEPISEANLIASYVALNKVPIIVNDNGRDLVMNNPNIRADWDSTWKMVLCPVLDSEQKTSIVLMLYREEGKDYDQATLAYLKSLCEWISIFLEQSEKSLEGRGLYLKNTRLLQIMFGYFEGKYDYFKYLVKNIKYVKKIVPCEKVFFYENFFDECPNKADLYFEKSINGELSMQKELPKIRFYPDDCFSKQVLKTKAILNVEVNEDDPRIESEIKNKCSEIRIKSIILVPIKFGEQILAILECVNAMSVKGIVREFNARNETQLRIIANLLAIALHFKKSAELLKKKIDQWELKKDSLTYLLAQSEQPETTEMIEKLIKASEFEFHESLTINEILPTFIFKMCQTITKNMFVFPTFQKLVIASKKMHQALPYHNFALTVCVVQYLFKILKKIKDQLTNLEKAALMIGALLLYCDHNGLDNEFMEKIKHPMTRCYKIYYREHHRVKISKLLLNHSEVLNHLPPESVTKIMDIVEKCYLKMHFYQIKTYRDDVIGTFERGEFNLELPKRRTQLLTLLFRCGAFARWSQSFSVAKVFCYNYYNECYNIGDVERSIGYELVGRKDRTKIHLIPIYETEFIENIVIPCLDLLDSILPVAEKRNTMCKKILKAYEILINLQGKKLWHPDAAVGKFFGGDYSD